MLNALRNFRKLPSYQPLQFQSPLYKFSQNAQFAKNAEQFRKKTRNIAIIAHVDHGKTTLVDSMLRYGGVNLNQECALDSNQLEREKGITILSKCTSIFYNDYNINIVDTPGHHDFGGQVERILGMVDGVCLVVCATEGPMTQSKFVLRKALEQNAKPLVIVNKVDRPSARPSDVVNEVFNTFCDLNCPDELLQYPLYFASGKNSWAVENLNDEKKDIECILKGIIEHVPQPKVKEEEKFSMLITQTHPDPYFGKNILGRVQSGEAHVGLPIHIHDQDKNLIQVGKISRITKKNGLSQIQLDRAFAGDIVSIAGLPKGKVTMTATQQGSTQKVIKCIKIDPPLMGVSVYVNTSPFCGKQGTKITYNDLKNRLRDEGQNDVALQVEINEKRQSITVRGRGDLHIGLLLQKIRREGFQFSVTPPEIVYKQEKGQRLQPIELISFEVEDRFQNLIMDKMTHRKGVYLESKEIEGDKVKLDFHCSTRGLLGIRSELLNETQGSTIIKSQFYKYEPYIGAIKKNPKGALISMCEGTTTAYCLKDLQKFGTLFVRAGTKVYNGMVIGENNKEQDAQLNPTKEKKLTNVRTHAHDEKINLIPAKMMSIEEAICYLRPDQLLEVTPKEIRIRKKELDKNGRDKYRRQQKNEFKNK